jgi:hypothetical protein
VEFKLERICLLAQDLPLADFDRDDAQSAGYQMGFSDRSRFFLTHTNGGWR